MIELLAPAGNLEKLKFAFEYGSDAAYLGWKKFSLRNLSGNFTVDDIKTAKELAEKLSKKIYITLNIYPYIEDIEGIYEFLNTLKNIEPHGLIVSDPGIIKLSKELIPDIPLHLSTQSNTTNYLSVKFWRDLGIKRVNLARELSLEDIKQIKEKAEDTEIEVFIHGAMCMSMSGRCLLSNFLTGRPSNKGECTHPCRWKYYVTEETREGEYFPVIEDNIGTYIFNSKDLCGINFLPELIKHGIDSVKIEGRMKSIYYLSNVVRVYREAIDEYYDNPDKFIVKKEWLEELYAVSNRDYTKGFFEKRNRLQPMENFETSGYIRNYDFIGIVKEIKDNYVIIEARNKILKGTKCEVISKNFRNFNFIIEEMFDINNEEIDFVQPMNLFKIKVDSDNIFPMSILRKTAD